MSSGFQTGVVRHLSDFPAIDVDSRGLWSLYNLVVSTDLSGSYFEGISDLPNALERLMKEEETALDPGVISTS